MTTPIKSIPLLTVDQILDLAQNQANRRNARRYADRPQWQNVGATSDQSRLWGEFPIKNKPPFAVQIVRDGPTFACTCARQKYPCAHALALYLLWLEQPTLFVDPSAPTWLAKPSATVTTIARHRFQPAQGVVEQQTYYEQRLANAQAGLNALAIQLRDLVKHGLATLPQMPKTVWQQMAARLVDAQIGGVAQQIRTMATVPGLYSDWPEQIVARMGRLHLLAEAVQRYETLSPAEQNDIAITLGWTPLWGTEESSLAVRDRWQVVGYLHERQGKRICQQHWLWGEKSNRAALVVRYSHGDGMIDTTMPTGLCHDATLHFYPSVAPLRAEIHEVHDVCQPTAPARGYRSIAAAHAAYRHTLAQQPWLNFFPMQIPVAAVVDTDDQWWLADGHDDLLPLPIHDEQRWQLRAMVQSKSSAGDSVDNVQPDGGPLSNKMAQLSVFGLWDGAIFQPCTVWQDGRILALALLRGVSQLAKGMQSVTGTRRGQPVKQLSELATAALLGADRVPVPTATTAEPLTQFLNTCQSNDRAADLLNHAGAVSLYHQIGAGPHRRNPGRPHWRTAATIVPAAQSHSPNDRARSLLAAILDGRHEDRLPEFLEQAARHGYSLPAEYLPQLLEMASRQALVRTALIPMLTPEQHRLAAANPAWHFATEVAQQWEGINTLWQQGNTSSRQLLLRHCRASQPELGRQLVEFHWRSADLSTRTWMLRALQVGLSMADEPFLEQALDDRVHTLRRAAAELLTRLPAARLCRRMSAAMTAILTWTPEAETAITVTVPAEITPQMVRDGVLIRQGKDAARNHSAHLTDMISAVPLEHWASTWQATPPQILQALKSSRWPNTLINAFAIAAQRQVDATWAHALLTEFGLTVATARVLETMPPAMFVTQLQRICGELETTKPLDKEHPLVIAVRRWPHAWDEPLVALWLTALRTTIRQWQAATADNATADNATTSGTATSTAKADSLLNVAIKQCARACLPTTFEPLLTALATLSTEPSPYQQTLSEAWSIVHFRQQIWRCFATQPTI